MIESITHNKENISVSFDKNKIELSGAFADGKKAFLLNYRIIGTSIKIYDFKVYRKREGLGTKVLNEFESCSKKTGLKKILGDLVENPDYSSKEVLIEFYNKMGFDIKPKNLGSQYAEISKKI